MQKDEEGEKSDDHYSNLLKEYNFLISHTPKGFNSEQKKAYSEIIELRQKLIRDQRVSFMFMMYKDDVESGKYQLGQLRKIFNPKLYPKNLISPSITQQTNIFLSYLYNNIQLLANAVLKFCKNERYLHLINVSIPSLFSFFTDAEILEATYVFYLHILNLSTPDVSTPILLPFFNSMITFRFIENVMSKFLPEFVADKRSLSKMKHTIVAHFAKMLFLIIKEKLTLLPEKIVTLIYLMNSLKWSVEDITKLFFDKFFMTQAEIYINGSPYSIILPQFKNIVNSIRNNTEFMNDLFSSFSLFASNVTIPSLYAPFEEKLITILISYDDLVVIWNCLMNYSQDLPYSVREFNVKNCDKQQTPFYINFSPKTVYLYEKPFRSLLFKRKETKHPFDENNPLTLEYEHLYQSYKNEIYKIGEIKTPFELAKKQNNTKEFIDYCLECSVCDLREQANEFELLLWYRMHIKIISEWLSISLSKTKIIKRIAISVLPPLPKADLFGTYASVFETPSTSQIAFIQTMHPIIQEAVNINKTYFKDIDSCWKKLLSKKKSVVDTEILSHISPAMQTIFWDSVQVLGTSDSVPFEKRFFVIFLAIKMLNRLPLHPSFLSKIIAHAITFSHPDKLLHSFLLLNVLIVRDSEFMSTINENELRAWTNFETIILNYVKSDDFPKLQLQVVGLLGLLLTPKK